MNTQHKLASVLIAVALSLAIVVPSVLADPVLEQISPTPKLYEEYEDFSVMLYSGTGSIVALVEPVDIMIPPGAEPNTSTSGCEAADFDGFTSGNIALIQRGSCYFRDKALNAQTAGATGVIIFNEGQPNRTGLAYGTLSGPGVIIPVVSTTYAVGEKLCELYQSGDVTVHMYVDISPTILTFFDDLVVLGTLEGEGPGESAERRLNALRNMIEMALYLIEDGYITEACQQLLDAYQRCDGESPPRDFVTGDDRQNLQGMIGGLMAFLECE